MGYWKASISLWSCRITSCYTLITSLGTCCVIANEIPCCYSWSHVCSHLNKLLIPTFFRPVYLSRIDKNPVWFSVIYYILVSSLNKPPLGISPPPTHTTIQRKQKEEKQIGIRHSFKSTPIHGSWWVGLGTVTVRQPILLYKVVRKCLKTGLLCKLLWTPREIWKMNQYYIFKYCNALTCYSVPNHKEEWMIHYNLGVQHSHSTNCNHSWGMGEKNTQSLIFLGHICATQSLLFAASPFVAHLKCTNKY